MSSISSAPPLGPAVARPLSLPRWLRRLRPGVILAGLVITFFAAAVIVPSLLAADNPLSINLAATNSSVSPQSMLFIPSLGQLAIVDGSQSGQGLILIDLNAVAVTGNSYY